MMHARSNKAMTLVELLVVVIILGLTSSMLYVLWKSNMETLGYNIATSTMWNDGNDIIRVLSLDVRSADGVVVNGSSTTQTLSFTNSSVTYVIEPSPVAGRYQLRRNDGAGNDKILTISVDTQNPKNDKIFTVHPEGSLHVQLPLVEQLMFRSARILVETEIYPRN